MLKTLATEITRDSCSFWKIADVFHMNSINLFVTPPRYCSQSCAQTKSNAVVLTMISVQLPCVFFFIQILCAPQMHLQAGTFTQKSEVMCTLNKIYQSLLIKCIWENRDSLPTHLDKP